VCNLNSILIEGIMASDPVDRQGICQLTVVSEREGKPATTLRVEAQGKIGDACQNFGRKGRGVRVVGQLYGDCQNGGLYVEAEHIEFKPGI